VNPTVYFFLEESLREEILLQEERIHAAKTVFAAFSGELCNVKAKILANEAKLNLNRVNIFVIANSFPECEEIQKIFCEDFFTVDISLVIILNENFSAPSQSHFNRIFLLSKKNERGEILPNSEKNICEIIAALPLLNLTSSRFNEILSAKSAEREEILFASAGFWQPPPSKINENKLLHRLAKILETEMNSGNFAPEPPKNFNIETANCEVSGVMAKPLRCWELWGSTVKEAENLLFGKEAERFFEKTYFLRNEREKFFAEKKTLREAVQEEKFLSASVAAAEMQIDALKREMEQAGAKIIFPFSSVDSVKKLIDKRYAIRFELETCRVACEIFSQKYSHLHSYIEGIRDVVKNLKALPVEETKKESMGDAPIAISLLREDGLIRENHVLQNASGEDCLLRVVGGFTINELRALK
jgi:hypothetical protein